MAGIAADHYGGSVQDLRARMKSLVKRGMRPVLARAMPRLDARIDYRAAGAVVQSPEFQRMSEYLPIVLNNILSQAGQLREAKRSEVALRDQQQALMEHERGLLERLVALENHVVGQGERAEYIRRELLYEMRFRGLTADQRPREDGLAGEGGRRPVPPSEGPIRLNLGSGHKPEPGYLNVDARRVGGPDVEADVGDLPFDPSTVAEIRSAHLLEHFAEEHLRRSLLPHWVSLLQPGGVFVAVVPDAQTMIAEYSAGRVPFDDLRRVLYG